jgi:hypothetical protein
MTEKLLKLRAEDAEDVQIVSAVLQDAIAPVSDMMFNAEDKNFIMVVQRLRREAGMDFEFNPERVRAAINVRGVTAVQTTNLDLRQPEVMLDLLTMALEGDVLTFIFAGDARIRLTLNQWSMLIEDFGQPWPAACNPCHEQNAQ